MALFRCSSGGGDGGGEIKQEITQYQTLESDGYVQPGTPVTITDSGRLEIMIATTANQTRVNHLERKRDGVAVNLEDINGTTENLTNKDFNDARYFVAEVLSGDIITPYVRCYGSGGGAVARRCVMMGFVG